MYLPSWLNFIFALPAFKPGELLFKKYLFKDILIFSSWGWELINFVRRALLITAFKGGIVAGGQPASASNRTPSY